MSASDRELEKLEIQRIMNTEGGRDFMYRILMQAGTFDSTFDSNPYTHAKNSGRRENGLWLDYELKSIAPASYLTMLKEHGDGN